MSVIRFECVKPNREDATQILEWRNSKETLEMSFHTQPIELESFINEFYESYFCFPNLPPLFATFEGARVAFVRLLPVVDPQHKTFSCCEVSINVAPNLRGQGLGSLILKELKQFSSVQGVDTLLAEIKVKNINSIKAFTRAGFVELDRINKLVEDTEEQVPIVRMIATIQNNSPLKEHTFVIAEAGSNWRVGDEKESYQTALQMIDAAQASGANAVKFQVFRPETTYVTEAGTSHYLADSGYNQSIQEIYERNAMPYEMIKELSDYCILKKVEFMASAFSPEDFAMVDPYVQRHKIASYEIGHIHLLECAAKSGKPLILSTGAATEFEIDWAVKTFYKFGGKNLTLLQCSASYPAPVEAMHLRVIPWLKHRFRVDVGLSDHSKGPFTAPIAAVTLGAKVIEKHFTLNCKLSGPDHAFAIEPQELKQMVEQIRETEKILGLPAKEIDPSEEELRSFARRGVQAIKEIHRGEMFTEGENFAILRPGKQQLGVHPRYVSQLEGKIAKNEIPKGKGIQFTDW